MCVRVRVCVCVWLCVCVCVCLCLCASVYISIINPLLLNNFSVYLSTKLFYRILKAVLPTR